MTLTCIVKRIVTAVLFLLGLAVTVVGSLVAAYQAARGVPRVWLLVVVALLTFFLGALLTTELVGKLGKTFLNRSALLTSAMLTALFVLGLYLAVLRPMHYPHAAPVARANTLYWNLPTGSRIAYSVYEPPQVCR